MTLHSDSNLFTAFNNIEEIKEEKAKVVRTEEMIKVIKETYNYNAPMLASILKTGTQSVYNWENGSRPSIRHFNKIKELYDGIVSKGKTNVLEQPEIANKELVEDVTAGTPFIILTSDFNGEKIYMNINKISGFRSYPDGTTHISCGNTAVVRENATEIFEKIRKKLSEDGEN